jgi:hypothetical protein
VMVRGTEHWRFQLSRYRLSDYLVGGGIISEFVLGLFPQLFLPTMIHIMDTFSNLIK